MSLSKKPRRFRSKRAWLAKQARTFGGPERRGVGKADWSTTLFCGKNLLGRVEVMEDWEFIVLARLNAGGAPGDEPRWRICQHAVLAQMRLSVYERLGADLGTDHTEHPPAAPSAPAALLRRGSSFINWATRSPPRPISVSMARRDRVALGALGIVSNKGGLAVELRIDFGGKTECSVLVIGSHLAAHDHKVHSRNKQAVAVLDHLYHRAKLGPARDSARGFERKLDIPSQFDHIIW